MNTNETGRVLTQTGFSLPDVDESEVWRYAGRRGTSDMVGKSDTVAADAELRRTLAEVIQAAQPIITPRTCHITLSNVNDVPGITDTPTLQKHLQGCDQCVLFAATVGVGIDRLMASWMQTRPTAALLLQALGTERVEALCDVFCTQMRERYGAITSRFSPGYGHWALENQRPIVALLDTYRQIGVALNESLLLTPTKTVTAVFGIKPMQ